jgi:hypothetical protein
MPNANTCPLCKQEMFPIAPPISRHEARLLRAEQANAVFRVSGLRHLLVRDLSRAAPADLTFSNDIQWSWGSMHLSSPSAHMFLAENLRTMPIGAHEVDAETLGSALVLMGHLRMGNARLEHRAYSDADRDTWREIIVDIWQSIVPHDGLRVYTETMYRNVVASLLDKYVFGAAQPSPFFEIGPLLDDLRGLVLFAVSRSGNWIEYKSPIDRPRARNIKVPLVFPCTASEPASLLATQRMREVYVRR